MVRDALMQKVIHSGEEPIIPFVSRMRQLFDLLGISTILVAGSSGAFFEVSDTVLQMKEYRPIDITEKAKEAAKATSEKLEFPDVISLTPDLRTAFPNKAVTESRKVKVRGNGTDAVSINHESVELRFVEQVVDNEQTNLLGALLRTLEEDYFDGKSTLPVCISALYDRLQKQGFAACSHGQIPGNLAMVRPQELWAMVNRYRGLKL
jgi:predicted ABC-class ATPase